MVKQPDDGWIPGRFLGIAWESGDSMTYYIEPDQTIPSYRNTVLIRSTVRPIKHPELRVSSNPPSGEIPIVSDLSFECEDESTKREISTHTQTPTDSLNEIDTSNKSESPELAPDDSAITDE